MNDDVILILAAIFLCGTLTGLAGLVIFQKIKLRTMHHIANEIIAKAELKAESMREHAAIELKSKQAAMQNEFEKLWIAEKKKLGEKEERIKQKEDKLEGRVNLIEKKIADIEKREAMLLVKKEQLELEEQNLHEKETAVIQELEKIAGLTSNEARELLTTKITDEVKADAANFIRRITKEAEQDAERKASTIIATAINRLAVPCVSEATVNTVALPNDEMKGRIIGKEGRNIRALENITGINFIIDDTPNAIVLSGFDPIRMHVAKTALAELVKDGRIHPTRIEEAVEKARIDTNKLIRQYGEDAALRAGAIGLHPEILTLLGKLKFRYSYGQNVLNHSLEVSHLMGLMAGELGLDVLFAKRVGLLHDMGKAVTHEIEGTHAVIGHDLALKYGEPIEVANGIGCHHREMEPITIEGSLCSAADAISASRPGARIEAVEEYIKRLKNLEKMALLFPGVEKAFALQAGRELRIFVYPDVVDDDGVVNLARDLTKKIEKELNYPGTIKVSVTREKRIVEYAM